MLTAKLEKVRLINYGMLSIHTVRVGTGTYLSFLADCGSVGGTTYSAVPTY